MSLTVPQKLIIAEICSYLISNSISRAGGAFAYGIDIQLPNKIRNVRDSIQYRYNNNPTAISLIKTSNYLLAMCIYQDVAINIMNGGTGGGIAPVIPSQGYPIYITSANFTTSTFYPNVSIFGTNVLVYFNEINRYLTGVEVTVSSTGVTINVAGFDALSNPYNLVIEKVYS